MIIAGFGAIGKTTLSKKYPNICDLESSEYKYYLNQDLLKLPVEERKGLPSRILNPDFPNNYYQAILNKIDDYDIVLISMHDEIIELLEQNKIKYFIAYPVREMLDEIMERCRLRGNNDLFLSGVREAYNRFYPILSKRVLWVKSGQYLENVLKDQDLIK